ncbi:MAG: hypothetical protein CVU56_11135 [Deltaproteobacteria bacterium HGW-Deltaproteobacteria-14]|jgi:hypothetical protein|nr:MAG: hypothetical protein CVU56_11135 [Deltaproteobacteria bacterium HGW-Deltaproteobacteria-14]
MKTLNAALLSLLLTLPAASALAAPPSPAGYVIDESDCASGGPSTYFFADGTALKADCGDDCPNVRVGTWKQTSDDTVTLKFTRAFLGKGSNPEDGPVPARTLYKDYTAAVETVSETDTAIWTGPDAADGGCVAIHKHGRPADVHALLRRDFAGRWPFTATRPVTEADLAGLSRGDLEIMRNEVYARYGHTFVNERLAKHFAAQPDYRPHFKNVSAFLSPLERANVAAIQAAEEALERK